MNSLTGDRSLRRVVADHMHPWLVPAGRGQMVMPPDSEILAAADRLIEGLRKEGYRIVRDE